LTHTDELTDTEPELTPSADEGTIDESPSSPPAPDVADLELIQTTIPDPAAADAKLLYTLELKNHGPAAAHNVVVTYVLPDEVNLLAATPVPQNNALPLIWNLGTLEPGASRSMRAQVQVRPWVTEAFTGEVIAHSLTQDKNPHNNRITPVTQISDAADLVITRIDASPIVASGAPITYEITYENRGPATARNLTLTMALPPSVSFGGTVHTAPPMRFVPALRAPDLGTLLFGNMPAPGWVLPSVSAGQTGRVVFTATTYPGMLGQVTGEAKVTSASVDAELDNNADVISTTVTQIADLALSLAQNPSPVIAGNIITYTLVYTNRGPQSAENVVITHTLTSDVQLGTQHNADPTITSTSLFSNTLNWSISHLPANSTETRTYTATVKFPSTTPLTHNLSIHSDTLDNDTANNKISPVTEVLNPGLRVQATVMPNLVVPNMVFSHTLYVTNTGMITFPVYALNITSKLPQHTQVISISDAPAVAGSTSLSWENLSPLAPHQSLSITLVLTNAHMISATQFTPTTYVSATVASMTMLITESVPVSLTLPSLTVTQAVAQVSSGVMTFTLNFSNTGPSTLDILPVTDRYDASRLNLVSAYPLPQQTEEGHLWWSDLTQAPPYGFDDNLSPGESLSLVVVFTTTKAFLSQGILQNHVTITEITDIYHNTHVLDMEVISYALLHKYLPLVVRR
jgi:uncharacterized repeat protein (TIGR01451 family)